VPLTASAPGKLVLLGEYSVLFGSPAVVLAVDRRAEVRLKPSVPDLWSVWAPGFAPARARFRVLGDGVIEWHPEALGLADRFVLLERVISSMVASDLVDAGSLHPFDAELETRSFFEETPSGPIKLGVGSSAALTTALASALAAWAGRENLLEPRRAWLGSLLDLHRDFQGGRGSGIDVAAAVMGGAVEFRLDDQGAVMTADHLELPDDLSMLFVWTGRSADTGRFLERLSERMTVDGGSAERALHGLGDVAGSGVEALRLGNTVAFLESVDLFYDAMDNLGRATGLPILSGEHLRLRRLATDYGVHYKPSGAGGGDMGLAFSADPAKLSALLPCIAEEGFRVVELSIDHGGLWTRRED